MIFLNVGIGLLAFLGFGIYDLSRNRKVDASVVKRYFTGNGVFTWVLSPLNTLLDILSLPYINKGIYKLEDLPATHQAEVKRLIEASHKENLVEKLAEKIKENPRTMFFFKWYGQEVKNDIDVPSFYEPYKYIKTIGVSVFNKKQSTSKHFGPMRATLRVLYNVNDMKDKTAYIEVGDTLHYWQDEKLFIFDDTLQHQSFNESDSPRYCLFVDILRPCLLPSLAAAFVSVLCVLLKGVNNVFYKNWKVVKP
ncbi:aspartyl/asparaginyl beta-hydroxylase domain-containing protein [Armatimonas sp.]|uniref:aspartyl/asparaginyl beta-hydroxylase domain-containing protein n=1 Tax=Armatimonas sp. TaxID=1872638 RepID=UPI00286C9DA6|nr:aspartyl/asparaginyl beta-hydroxylase domain-containing protein [Armatimonas sp.]